MYIYIFTLYNTYIDSFFTILKLSFAYIDVYCEFIYEQFLVMHVLEINYHLIKILFKRKYSSKARFNN